MRTPIRCHICGSTFVSSDRPLPQWAWVLVACGAVAFATVIGLLIVVAGRIIEGGL